MAEKITAAFIIQIAGKPVENVEKALNVVLDKLKAEKDNFKVVSSDVGKPELDEETTLYGGFLEVSAKFENASKLLAFIVDYTPSSIEVEDPEKIVMNNNDFSGILNDVSALMLKTQNENRNLRAYAHSLNKKMAELEGSKK
ncbi:MAG: hypothetical protein PF569_04050 [Candidatus Woesearchaeota archaeon]|jgi:hypothetical protein|nr:hypothetical protein [Candidatus Woesearchaeota archaeon]